MDSESNDSAARRVLSSHILSASVVMIGVSTTLIGLVKVAKAHMVRAVPISMPARRIALSFQCARIVLFHPLVGPSSAQTNMRPHIRSDFCALVGICLIASFLAYEFI